MSPAGTPGRLALRLRAWRLVPLAVALAAAGLLARRLPLRWPVTRTVDNDGDGITILIPERGTPDLLAETLAAALVAAARVDAPVQVVVVVNGAAEADYAGLRERWPTVEWQFHARALGYNGAVVAGLREARHAWTYLLNSDMRLDPDALVALLPYRLPHVFAVSSQIFFVDPRRRREETGWSDHHWNPDQPEVYERTPGPGRLARGTLYPGGGSSLCRTAPLRRYARGSRDYSPFYWEDADWGVRAWSEGWELLFCPASHAHHHHRGTVNRYHDAAEIERIIARNALLFDLRHAWSARRARQLIAHVAASDRRTRAELAGLGLAWRVFRSRLSTHRARLRGVDFAGLARHRYLRAPTPGPRRPRVLLVSPFAVFPPTHGGARRIAELTARLAGEMDFILLGDESSLYSEASDAWLEPFMAALLVEGRGDGAGASAHSLEARMQRHAWPHLRRELDRLVAIHDPDIVQVEFMELALLADMRQGRARWLLALHDVYLSGDADAQAADALQRTAMARFDALTVCSAEDAALVDHRRVVEVGNGAIDRRASYVPSPATPRLLFMGPFRYAQNLAGIREFIDTAWPDLRRRFPQLTLAILGGAESAALAGQDARFSQPGIELVSRFVDPAPWLAECSLTINPQGGIRGSSLKLIESLLAGRVCVSTRDGARGFGEAGLAGLVIAEDIAAMGPRIAAMLADDALRHRLERSADDLLDAHTWDAMAARQRALYTDLLAEARAGSGETR